MTPGLGHDPGDPVVVVAVAGAIPDDLAPDHEPGQDLVELTDLIGLVRPEALGGTLGPDSIAVPRLHLGVPGPDEQGVITVGVARSDDRHRIWLMKSGQIVKVGILVELEVGVIAPDHLDCGRDDGDCVVADLFGETGASFGICVWHGPNGTAALSMSSLGHMGPYVPQVSNYDVPGACSRSTTSGKWSEPRAGPSRRSRTRRSELWSR